MHYFFRLTAAMTGALLVFGQAGCALTSEADSVKARSVTPGKPSPGAVLVSDPAVLYADPANYVELNPTQSGAPADDFVHGYSNTFIAEMPGGYPAGLFVSAAYFEWGGYPVYYPYPTTYPSRGYQDQWAGGYGNWSSYNDYYRGYGGYRGSGRSGGGTAAASPAHSGPGPVSSKGYDVTGGIASGRGGTSGANSAAQTRGSQGGEGSYNSGYGGNSKSSGRSYRGGQRGMSQRGVGNSRGGARGRTGSPWRSQPR